MNSNQDQYRWYYVHVWYGNSFEDTDGCELFGPFSIALAHEVSNVSQNLRGVYAFIRCGMGQESMCRHHPVELWLNRKEGNKE